MRDARGTPWARSRGTTSVLVLSSVEALLEFYVGAHLKHLIRRNLEERCGAQCIPRHEREQTLTPHCHPRPVRRNQRLTPEEKCRALQGDTQAVRLARRQNLVDVGILHEPVARHDAVKPLPAAPHCHALLATHVRYVFSGHSEEDDLLV